MSFSQPRRSLIVFACAGVVLGVVVWASGRIQRPQTKSQEIDLRIQNKTAALKITSTRKVGEDARAALEVEVMNQSDKTVLAYTLTSGKGSVTSFGLSLGPGEYNTERIPFANLEPSVGDKSVSDLRLSAVYLEDGSSEGEKIEVARLNNHMIGMQEQAAISLDILRKASGSGDPNPERLAKMVEDGISSTPVTEETTDGASDRLAGRAYIKEKVSREMNNLRDLKDASGTKMQERLLGLMLSVEKRSGLPKKATKDGDK